MMKKILLLLLLCLSIFSCTIEGINPKAAILVYHDILNSVSNGDTYSRTVNDFENDLKYLKYKNYDIISMNSLYSHIKHKTYLKNPSVVITFDDTVPTDNAIRLLKKYKFKTVVFLKTDILEEDIWNKIIELNNYRTDQNKKLFYFESHSHTHPKLNYISDDELYYQLETSKDTLENRLNTTVKFLALPFGEGAYNNKIIETAKNIGYKGIRTIIYGYEDIFYSDSFNLKAIIIDKDTKINYVLM